MDDTRTSLDQRDGPTEDDGPTPAATDLADLLAGGRAYIQTLPSVERQIATLAANGAPAWEIAQTLQISQPAVARTLDSVLAAITGRQIDPVETGGLGADTDPGVTGGYDDPGVGEYVTDEPEPRSRQESDDPRRGE